MIGVSRCLKVAALRGDLNSRNKGSPLFERENYGKGSSSEITFYTNGAGHIVPKARK